MSLRPYQELALAQIREHYRAGNKKVLLKLPTGAGKTVVFSEVLKGVSKNGKRGVMAVAGRQLVDQASERLFRENVFHGVQMAGHWNRKAHAPIQICSIDTLTAREKYPEADLVVIDECHMATSERFKKFADQYPNAFFLSVTATPYVRESLTHVAEVVVAPISMRELIEQGYLVPPRYFAPSNPDLKGVKKQNGDFVSSQLEERMSTLTGDIIEHWRKHGESRPTILFACNIRHSESLVEQFKAAGIPSEHIEGNHSFTERKAAIERLRRGETKILSNVGVLCTGVDIPFVGCIVMARPTHSYSLYIQQAGRGTRLCPETGKRDFILLDHAGNVLRHGFITDEPDVDLEGAQKKEPSNAPTRCASCFNVYERGEPACPICGFTPVRESSGGGSREAEQVDGILEEIKELPEAAAISAFVRRLRETQKKRGYKKSWVYFQVKEKYGDEVAQKISPRKSVPPWFLG